MVRRVYVEKRPGLSPEAEGLLADLRDFLDIPGVGGVRVLHRYDVENLDGEAFEKARRTVFSEPQVDIVWDEAAPIAGDRPQWSLAVEALPGQFDQRADSAAQCIQLMTGGERPLVRAATEYLFESTGEGPFPFTEENQEKIRRHLINPVESREASREKPETLAQAYAVPDHVETVSGFAALRIKGTASSREYPFTQTKITSGCPS